MQGIQWNVGDQMNFEDEIQQFHKHVVLMETRIRDTGCSVVSLLRSFLRNSHPQLHNLALTPVI